VDIRIKYCKKCNKIIDKRNKKNICFKCQSLYPELNPNYIDGRSLKKYCCIDCHKKIHKDTYLYGGKRCSSCSRKGENNSNFGNKWNKKQKEEQSILTKNAMNKLEIINKMKENHADVSGDKNPMHGVHRFGIEAPGYIHGNGYAPYPIEFNCELKESIRQRDNYTCQNCGMTEEEHLIVIGRVLDIHHIDYDKQNCNENNLITLCQQCNLRANSNRDYWQKFYKLIMEKISCPKKE